MFFLYVAKNKIMKENNLVMGLEGSSSHTSLFYQLHSIKYLTCEVNFGDLEQRPFNDCWLQLIRN